MESRKHVDFVSSIVFIGLSVYVIVEGYKYYQGIQIRGRTPFYESPGFFPIVIGGALLFCSLMMLVRSLKGGMFGENIRNIKEGASTFLKSPMALKAFIGCVWMGLYVYVLLPAFRFRLGSMIFLLGFIFFLQGKEMLSSDLKRTVVSIVKIFVISGVTVLTTHYLFQVLFRVPLP